MDRRSTALKALAVSTFSGAFSEIALKIAVFIHFSAKDTLLSQVVLLLALGVLPVLPSVIVSPFAGRLADAVSKPAVIRFSKLLELVFAVIGAVSIARENYSIAIVSVLLLGVASAIFTPVKFAILPDILEARDLSRGNGLLMFAKYGAFVAGIASVGTLYLFGMDASLFLASLTTALAVCGMAASLLVTSVVSGSGAAWGGVFSISGAISNYREIRANRQVFLCMVSFAYFLIIGAVLQLNTSLYLRSSTGLGQDQLTLLLCAIMLGIGLGGICAGIVSRGKVEIGLVPVATMGVALSLFLMPFIFGYDSVLFLVYFLAGVMGGISVVPLYAFFQQQSPLSARGAYQGVSHAFSQAGLLIATIVLLGLEDLISPNPGALFILAAVSTMLIGAYALKLMPIALVRCINWLFSNTVYRIRSYGTENVPEKGGALLVCNHISYFDPLLVSASVSRSVRFLIRRGLFQHPLLGLVLRTLRAIPVSQNDRPKELVASLIQAREALEKGQIVCVFAEGEPSRIGHMLPFNRGIEFITKGIDVPIIPMYLDQTWGSLFDFGDGQYWLKVPKELPYPASLTFGKPMRGSVRAYEIRQAIAELGISAFTNRKREHQLLHLGFLKEAKAHPFRECMVESSGKKVTRLRALVGAFLFSDYLGKVLKSDEKQVGVFLPPCIGSALANLALLMRELVPVNLNYTASKEASDSAISQAGIRHVITSRMFVSKVQPPENVEFIYAEDIVASVTGPQRILTLLKVLLLPTFLLQKLVRIPKNANESLATIVFSSGSTGIPKGVMLTHANISSNVESMYNALNIRRSDILVGILPFFHSFGFATGLWLPLLAGIKAVYHFSPLDAEIIGQMVEREKGTILLGTPSFLSSYIRRIPKEQFSSLRWVIVGAEKLRSRIAASFTDKFGIVPLEGYGCTELSPVAMINVPDLRKSSRAQVGNKPGTVGHPIPGEAVKIVDPETREPLPPNKMGLLLVKGPNVMKGYLGLPDKTAEVIWDGWYVTGDLASLDEAGFVTLHDRLSRFSKIAGEMVPHGGVEDAIHKVLSESEQMCVVTSVPDERKGEKLVVLYTKAFEVRGVLKSLSEAGLPNLWIPKAEDFFQVETIPVLGSGKLDLQNIRRLAKELCLVAQ